MTLDSLRRLTHLNEKGKMQKLSGTKLIRFALAPFSFFKNKSFSGKLATQIRESVTQENRKMIREGDKSFYFYTLRGGRDPATSKCNYITRLIPTTNDHIERSV